MGKKEKKFLIWLLLSVGSVLFFMGCAGMEGDHSPKVPGVMVDTGTLVDQEKSWRGMVLGGAFSPAIKGKISEISRRAGEEAIRKKMPIVYLSTDGFQRLEVLVLEGEPKERCPLIQERTYQDGTLVREEVKPVCE